MTTTTAPHNARLRCLTSHLHVLSGHVRPPLINHTAGAAAQLTQEDTGITYAELCTPGQRGATPERVEFLEKNGYVILDDFVGHPLIKVMEENARRIANECNAPYPQDVHKYGYIHRGVADDSTSAIRGIYHPKFRAPCFAEFFSSPAFLDFTKSWTGLEPEQCAFGSVPLIFCSGNSEAARERLRESWVPGGGGWYAALSRCAVLSRCPLALSLATVLCHHSVLTPYVLLTCLGIEMGAGGEATTRR